MTKEVKSYFNMCECGRNLLDRLEVTYQREFMATPQNKYYTRMLENTVNMNNCNGETLSNKKLQKSVSGVREETDAEHERNINEISCNNSFQYYMQNKDVTTINYSVYYESDEQVDTISDSNKQVDPRRDPMAETHIVNRVLKLSVRVGLFESVVIRGGIRNDLVTNVLEN